MKATPSLKKHICFSTACFALALSTLIASTAKAADSSPFDMDTSNWISFDHYKENTKLGRKATPAPVVKDDEASDAAPVAAPPVIAVPTSAPATVIAAPSRPLDLPVMPGMNKGYNIQVKSTEDDRSVPAAQITNMDTTPDVQFKEHNWQKAAEAAHQAQHPVSTEDDPEDAKPLDIRMSFLPNPKVIPDNPVIKKAPRRSLAVSRPVAIAQDAPKKAPADLAACAAIDAYKKSQLQAIQSDRQTLADLQQAIAQLGLQKQLSFMSDAQGSLNTQAQNQPLKLDGTESAKVAQP